MRGECKWNDDDEKWMLPKMVIDRTSLPNTGTIMPGRGGLPTMNGDGDDRGPPPEHDFSDERLRQVRQIMMFLVVLIGYFFYSIVG